MAKVAHFSGTERQRSQSLFKQQHYATRSPTLPGSNELLFLLRLTLADIHLLLPVSAFIMYYFS